MLMLTLYRDTCMKLQLDHQFHMWHLQIMSNNMQLIIVKVKTESLSQQHGDTTVGETSQDIMVNHCIITIYNA